MLYQQAVEQADSGEALLVSYSGGRSRYVRFLKDNGGAVSVRLFDTTIAVFGADGITVRTGGHNTATTVEALNHVTGRGLFGTVKGVLYLNPYGGKDAVPFTENMMIGYDGKVLRHGTEQPPVRPGRRHRDEYGVLR